MYTLEELKEQTDLINEIEWDMTPEEAVKQYLEWGNTDWGSGKYVIRSKSDYTTYFVVNCWRKPYLIYLINFHAKFRAYKSFLGDAIHLVLFVATL